VPAESPESLNLKPGDSAWMLIRPKSCHSIRAARHEQDLEVPITPIVPDSGTTTASSGRSGAQQVGGATLPDRALPALD
jgi:hypothetical protein